LTFDLPVNNARAKAVVLLIAVALAGGPGYLCSSALVIGALTDERISVPIDALAAAAVYFPESARLNARIAEYELGGEERDLSLAEYHARRAVDLSPFDYTYRLSLSSILEAEGNRAAAGESLRSALALAPNNADVHWRLANLLLRLGEAEESASEFRKATSGNVEFLGATLDLIWSASGGRIDQVEAVTGQDTKSRLVLAQFLLKQSRAPEAVSIFSNIDRRERLRSPEASAFLSALMDSGRLAAARELWLATVSGDDSVANGQSSLIWNGSFEADSTGSFPQFNWQISPSEYAVIAVNGDIAHTGSHSLRIDFTGRDTTRIDGEIKQLVIVRPGRRYWMQCYARSDNLVTPEGPCVTVLDPRSSREIARSNPVPAGTSDWGPLSCEFIAPNDCEAVLIEIRRLPKFSYDDPTRGTVWCDDFALMELGSFK
jgi:tetratricopeptide (TPR) repeat protein